MIGKRASGAKSKLEYAILSVVDAAVCQWKRMMHCTTAVPVMAAQSSLVLFSRILDFKNADQNLDTALSFYIPVLNTLMCPPTVIITRDTVDIILG